MSGRREDGEPCGDDELLELSIAAATSIADAVARSIGASAGIVLASVESFQRRCNEGSKPSAMRIATLWP